MNPVIHVVEVHDQVLGLLRQHPVHPLRVLHLDFHCDLRGLLINRRSQRAYRIWDRFPDVDQGNFLTHAILEGLVSGIRWVHDDPGGRRDDLKTVKYETDLTALAHRCLLALRGVQGVPISYEVIPSAAWTGIDKGEVLDIDWDFFASRCYPSSTIQQRVDAFLARDFANVPEQIYVCYSPDYSHPSREQFRRFVAKLSDLFRASVVEVPYAPGRSAKQPFYKTSALYPLFRLTRQLYHNGGLALRKLGIY